MKRDVFDGLKIEGLMEALNIPRYAAAGILTGLWKITDKYYPRGDIGRASNRQIAERLGWPVKKADILINALLETRWLDSLPGDGRLYVHDWHEHCEDTTHRLLARKRWYFANNSEPKLNRLEKDERPEIARYYEAQRVTTDLCARRAHSGSPTSAATATATAAATSAATEAATPPGADSALGSDSAVGSADPASTGGEAAAPPPKRRAAKPKSGASEAEGHAANNLADVLGRLQEQPESHDGEETRRRSLNALWSRIRRVTGDSSEDMAWWASALPAITENPTTSGVLLTALDYAADCADEAIRQQKGLGPLKNPGGYVTSRVLAAARAENVAIPARPRRVKANA